MPYYLIELYSANSNWLNLSIEKRKQFLDEIQKAMGPLMNRGIEILTIGQTDNTVDKASAAKFLGIWQFPDIQTRDALLAGIKASGWYDYFDHLNAACSSNSFTEHMEALIFC